MPSKLNLAGKRFGKLRVISEAPNSNNCTRWNCWCDCGNITTVFTSALRSGNTSSCGCGWYDTFLEHGMTHTPTHKTWVMMRQRCNNKNDDHYKDYGGRGIRICERWNKFINFFEDMGERPEDMTLDRIDVNGNYEPRNCRWATQGVQNSNRRTNKYLTLDGRTMTMAKWANETGINWRTISYRKQHGWTDMATLQTPVKSGA